VSRTPRARVLVVDDSAFARKVVRDLLAASGELEVVGVARDGLEALEKVAELRPDVMTLDLVMPGLDGVGVLRALPPTGGPRVVVVTASAAESDLAVEALQLGAVDFVHKPSSLATDRLYEIGATLVARVVAAASARPRAAAALAPVAPRRGPVATELVAIGTSTGGPQALTALLPALPGDLPCAVVIALHIPGDYTPALAQRLDAVSRLEVREAAEGLELVPGRAVLARGGTDLLVTRRRGQLVAHLATTPERLHHPSVDVLFESAAATCGAAALGVVLTGMGDDGLAGARALRAAGGRVFTESESSAVIYGMPRAVHKAGLSDGVASLEEMAARLVGAL
jgi:two-component system, chemotaxis family, protein-glutamate methylesterase/glutaminase